MNKRYFSWLLAIAAFVAATAAQATVHRVYPGESLQAAVDGASPGDTILVEPGVYTTDNAFFGLRISTDNLRLIGKVAKGQGDDGKVVLLHSGDQYTGIYAGPAACGPDVPVGGCAEQLQGFYIRGFTVKDFPGNGIQTRFVNDFTIIGNESSNNRHNGIYPTISANGLVQNNVSYGALDTAMWVAASQNVRVIGNDLSNSPIGLEVNVSVDIEVMHNDVYNNTVGIALLHPNSAGNLPRPDMGNWVVRQNNVYDNNLPNPADPEDFQGLLPPGIGILVMGVSNNVIEKNTVENNNFVGIGVLGWCSATLPTPRNCFADPPVIGGDLYDPSVNNNLIAQNKVSGNGTAPPPGPLAPLAADITYYSDFAFGTPFDESSSGNCFKKNKPAGYTEVSSEGTLPTDGC